MIKPVAGRGPVKESNGLDQGDAIADRAALINHAADDRRRYGMGGGDLREVVRESWDCEARVRGSGVRIWIRVIAVVVFN